MSVRYSTICASILYLGVSAVTPAFAQTPITLGEIMIEKAENVPGAEELNTVDEVENKDSDIEFAESSNTIDAPSVLAKDLGDDTFFDSENDLTPQGEMAQQGPVTVNPVYQPASKLVLVKRMTPAKEGTSSVVAAERAMSLGLYDAAFEIYDELYRNNHKDSKVLLGRAVSLQKLERFDEAMSVYEELSILEPNNIEVQVNMLGLLGTRYPSIALRRLMNLHDNNRNNVALTGQLAVSFAQSGDLESALKYLGIASSMDPKNASHFFNMAVIADRAGNQQSAVLYYEKALEVDSIYGGGRSVPREAIYERLAKIR